MPRPPFFYPLSLEFPYEDPDRLLSALGGLPARVVLDSGQHFDSLGRYSFFTADPFLLLTHQGIQSEWVEGNRRTRGIENPFTLLGNLLKRFSLAHNPELPPFQGGAAGYFGYELARHCRDLSWTGIPPAAGLNTGGDQFRRHPRPSRPATEIQVPDLRMGFYDWVVALDHETEKGWIVSTGFPETDPKKRERSARETLRRVRRKVERELAQHRGGAVPGNRYRSGEMRSNFSKSEYLKAIRRIQDHIREGDVYQVNLAQRFGGDFSGSALDLFRNLRRINPSPFAAFLDYGSFQIVSSSPERFLRLGGNRVETRPIKGTRPRSPDPVEDERLAEELQNSVKDRAENLMIVDLLRNDLSKVCAKNSVRVPRLFSLERYPTVFHLVSTIAGTLRPGKTAIDLMEASFPGGSITGAPKIRAMKIISELERIDRGPYCGSIAYISFSGQMDSNIVIRTVVRKKNRCAFHVGGGITSDSDPEAEYQETLDKGKALFEALASGRSKTRR